MSEHRYALGDIVALDPIGDTMRPKGRVVGLIEYIDGALGYVVSTYSITHSAIQRHYLCEAEIHAIKEEPSDA